MLQCLENITNFEKSKEILNEKKLIVKEYKNLGLYLVKYNKDENITMDADIAKCRGLIMDYNNKVVCIPPMKSINNVPLDGIVYEEFIDGTMINVFYYNGWHISTRSCIGANCRWYSNKRFNNMFEESKDFDIEKLDPLYCYNFVLKHSENRIVTKYSNNDIILVGAYNLETCKYVDTVNIQEHLQRRFDLQIKIPERYMFNSIEDANLYVNSLNYDQQGLVLKVNEFRSKMVNPHYNYVKHLRGNNRNIKYTFFELRRAGLLNEYINYYPEYKEQFNVFNKELYAMTRNLFNYYQNFRVKKNITYDEIDYQYRPLVYKLHGDYLTTKNIVNFSKVKNYVNSLPSAQILFVLHYKAPHPPPTIDTSSDADVTADIASYTDNDVN